MVRGGEREDSAGLIAWLLAPPLRPRRDSHGGKEGGWREMIARKHSGPEEEEKEEVRLPPERERR